MIADCQIEQDAIGQLVMSYNSRAKLIANISQSALKRPETMRVVGRHPRHSFHHVAEQNLDLDYRRLHPQPYEDQLRQRTSCPPRRAILSKPTVRRQMVDMCGPRQGQQNIYVEQGDGHL